MGIMDRRKANDAASNLPNNTNTDNIPLAIHLIMLSVLFIIRFVFLIINQFFSKVSIYKTIILYSFRLQNASLIKYLLKENYTRGFIMFDFGLRIRQLREQHKMSQEQLGRIVGRSKSVISSYENNIKVPPLEILTQIAVVFHVSLDYLVGIDKADMLSLSGLSKNQKYSLRLLIDDFKDPSPSFDGLSPRQQEILNLLMCEFSKK